MSARWTRHLLLALAVAVASHLAAVWLLPRAIMHAVLHSAQARAMDMHHKAAFPPPVDASARRIVLPSPDLLYSLCSYDLADGPVRIQAHPQWKNYWSLALYAANSDNFFVVNDRQALAGNPAGAVDLWITDGSGAGVPVGAHSVVSPTREGLVLMRVLTGNYAADAAAVEAARRTFRCDARPAAS